MDQERLDPRALRSFAYEFLKRIERGEETLRKAEAMLKTRIADDEEMRRRFQGRNRQVFLGRKHREAKERYSQHLAEIEYVREFSAQISQNNDSYTAVLSHDREGASALQ
jgi:2-phosphoglycerate kinase